MLFIAEEAIIVALRRYMLICYCRSLIASMQPTIPYLTRPLLHRCLQRHGFSRSPEVEGGKPSKRKFKAYPIGYFHIGIAELQTAEGKLYPTPPSTDHRKASLMQEMNSMGALNRLTHPPFNCGQQHIEHLVIVKAVATDSHVNLKFAT
ncbi:hypothetical protein ACVIHH_008333 [Bradyrhizobium sp. USDA 4518]